MNVEPGLFHFLVIGAVLFFIGIYGFLTRRNLITMLMSVELILNSVNINFIAFNKYLWPGTLDGTFFTIFINLIICCRIYLHFRIIIFIIIFNLILLINQMISFNWT